MSDLRSVMYADFGAKGDGITDDFEAIYNAHIYANEKKIPVFAEEGAVYYPRPSIKTSIMDSFH